MTSAPVDLRERQSETLRDQAGRATTRDALPALMARADFRAWLTDSCERQNLPVVIEDRATVTKVAALLK